MNPLPPAAPAPDDEGTARVRELLPWYARGALNAEDHAFVQSWLLDPHRASAEITAELEWLCSTEVLLREAEQARSAEAGERQLVDEGLARLMARVQAAPTEAGVGGAAAPPTPRTGLWERLHAWVAGRLPARAAPLAWALVGLMALQAGVIGMLLSQAPPDGQVPLGGGAASASSDVVVFTVAFKSQATELDIRTLLSKLQGEIVGGPSALGLYRVAVPRARADAAQAAFGASDGVVESAQRGP